ncbi:MAG: DegV family protein [Oscillospiraceae bacterium]|jgi:DegV family protein with EDD domain|nr:DegV family protein [Oscillospiraceae bacterium]
MSFDIITDSASNLPKSYAEKNNVGIISLKYTLEGEEYDSYVENENDDSLKSFYARMEEKASTSTSNINAATFEERFTEVLEKGRDILYISFSSGLSSSYSFAEITAAQLKEKYPDRKIIVVDSLCVTYALGLLIHHVVKMRDDGGTMEEIRDWLEDNKKKMIHLFTVNDLVYLKRGGRISPATALVGTLLGVKPVMHVTNEGKLEKYDKIKGRKKSLSALVDKLAEMIEEPAGQIVALVHGDCEDDAQYVKKQIMEKAGVKDVILDYLTPIIGAHSGPGTIAMFFMGGERMN